MMLNRLVFLIVLSISFSATSGRYRKKPASLRYKVLEYNFQSSIKFFYGYPLKDWDVEKLSFFLRVMNLVWSSELVKKENLNGDDFEFLISDEKEGHYILKKDIGMKNKDIDKLKMALEFLNRSRF